MADITNPQAVRFVNEQVRPMAETLRALKVELDAMMVQWFAGTNALVANDKSALADKREAEGISRLTGEDVVGLIVVVQAIQGLLDTAGYADRIAKPCVRPLKVQ
jgi:hypothetical protein